MSTPGRRACGRGDPGSCLGSHSMWTSGSTAAWLFWNVQARGGSTTEPPNDAMAPPVLVAVPVLVGGALAAALATLSEKVQWPMAPPTTRSVPLLWMAPPDEL